MQSDQQRAVWAVVLSGIVLFLWQYFFVPKIAPPTIVPTTTSVPIANVANNTTTQNVQRPQELKETEEFFVLTNDNKELKISNKLNISSINSINSSENMLTTLGANSEFGLHFYSPDKKQLTNLVVANGPTASELLISHPDGLSVKLFLDPSGKVAITGQLPKGYGYGISGKSTAIDGSLSLRHYFYHINKLIKYEVGDNGDDSGALKWIGVDYGYHFLGLVSPDSPASDVSFNAQGYFSSRSFPLNDQINSYLIFVKKEYDYLKALGDSLHLTVDFGMFAFLAVPMLWLLKMFHGLVANYGWAIVLLTLLIRLLTFPLQWSSLKGMKKMQTLQPQLAKLKEKYKDDPVAMQKETMEVFKRSGVNPLSGCFPLLLQMPIFFALYSVLYNAVELVGADFSGWIHDLSAKDPYYILPIAMAVAMFVQQKITPTTITDKMQQRIFLFMPLIFGFFMKDLPSGLSLYIFVSTVAGIFQQFFVFSRLK
jgi:YidC/Oxa1 family membrane protein insertase